FITDNTCKILATPSTNDCNNEDTHEFLFDYKAFQNAKERASLDECNEVNIDIIWEDMDSIEKDSIEKSSTISSDENYLISDIECTNLVLCVLIDIFDGQIKRCPNYAKPRHTLYPLRQLVETSLTNSEQSIFLRLQQTSELSIKKTKEIFIEICSLPDSKPEDWDMKRIREIWLRFRRQIKRQKQNA
ncbi:1751_t:CDS:2, partial [Funneliformis mosseae]